MENKKRIESKAGIQKSSIKNASNSGRSISKGHKFFVAIDSDGEPIATTFRSSKKSCLQVLTQGAMQKWKAYERKGYRVEGPVELYSKGRAI